MPLKSLCAAFLIALLGPACRGAAPEPTETFLYGVLQDHPQRWGEERAAGMGVAVLALSWSAYEPKMGSFDQAYAARMKRRLGALRAAGFLAVLDPGWQYPPAWIFAIPNSRYANQFGNVFCSENPGMAGFNSVFNREVRARQQAFLQKALADLGTDFYALRLGGGWFNELNFPPAVFKGRANCYWAFDSIAQGRAPGLPEGVTVCPVAGWIPGVPCDNHREAERFADWYLNSLKNYHDWQIATARRYFPGSLVMLYPSWGIRPGQLSAAIAGDLAGKTGPERNGEVQRGFDFARYIAGITDPGVVVYCTWLDADSRGDQASDVSGWSPIHYLSSLAAANPVHLRVWGENTGHGDLPAMERSFHQMRSYHLIGLFWAFEPELYDGRCALMPQLSDLISRNR